MIMKRNTLKLSLLSLMLLASPLVINATPADDFLDTMVQKIKSSVEGIVEHVEDFIEHKNPSESFSQYIQTTTNLLDSLHNNIVTSFEAEKLSPSDSSSACYKKIVTIAHEVVLELHSKLNTIHTVMVAHRKSAAPNNATKLCMALKTPLMNFSSDTEINKLDAKLVVLHAEIKNYGNNKVATEIAELRNLIAKIKTEATKAQSNIKLKLLHKVAMWLKNL